jgi:hypothetical protein
MYAMNPKDVPVEFPDGRYNHAEERPTRLSKASAQRRPTAGQRFDEAAPVIGAPPVYGPPVVFIASAWLLLVLLVIPPAAFLITLVLVAAVPVALLAALVAPAYLLVRHLHARHVARRRVPASAPDQDQRVRPVPATTEVAGPHGWRPAGAHLVPIASES